MPIPSDWAMFLRERSRARSRDFALELASAKTLAEHEAVWTRFAELLCADLERYIEATQGVQVRAPEGIQ